MGRRVALFLGLLISLPFLVYGALMAARPARTPLTQTLFPGATYNREPRNAPRPLQVHVVTLDLAQPGLDFVVTPSNGPAEHDTDARTTAAFAREFGADVAINAGFFWPFHTLTPWDYYPKSGDPVNVAGVSMANGDLYSSERSIALCLGGVSAEIRFPDCAPDARHAVGGNQWLVYDGEVVVRRNGSLAPRTAAALSADRKTLWLIVVDGRQPGYSEGVSLLELAGIARDLGADRATNLDGGGSTTLVAQQNGRVRALNAPIHTRIPLRQRPVANHLGIVFSPPAEEASR